MASATAKKVKAQEEYEPREVVIKHGLFWYHAREAVVRPNKDTGELEEVDALVEKIANQNERLEIPLAKDYIRGVKLGAFWTDDELGVHPQSPGGDSEVPTPPDEDAIPTNLSALDSEDLVDYLMSTGMFDGKEKPSVPELLDTVGDDPALAQKLLDAEGKASGGQSRTTLEEGLLKIVERHENE